MGDRQLDEQTIFHLIKHSMALGRYLFTEFWKVPPDNCLLAISAPGKGQVGAKRRSLTPVLLWQLTSARAVRSLRRACWLWLADVA